MATDLPKGHWIHAAMSKEKARVKKNKAAGAGKTPLEKPVMASAQPMSVSGDMTGVQ